MQIKKPIKIAEDVNRDLYWAVFRVTSDNSQKESRVLACASWEYLCDKNRTSSLSDGMLSEWADEVIEKITKNENAIFNKKTHYLTYANTPEGNQNGLEFLIEMSK